MGLAEHVVVGVVSRSHLQAARTKLDVHIAVLNHRNHTAHQRHNHLVALQPLVLWVFRVDTHGGVAHDGFGARGSHHGEVALSVFVHHVAFGAGVDVLLVGKIVFQVIEFRFLITVNHFFVAQCGLSLRVPVHHAQSAVDESLVVEVAEHLDHAFATLFVHGERSAAPVAACAQTAELLQDDAAVLVGPVPGVLQKFVASKVAFANALLRQAVHHLRLSGDRSVVGARHPARVLALHAGAAHQNVLDCFVEHVAHVQHASHVWRWNHDGVWLTLVGNRLKQVVVCPILVPFIFNLFWVVLCS